MARSAEPVRIAFCITDLDPGGAERALLQIVTRLDRAAWSPTIICLAPEGALASEFLAAGIPVRCLGARGPRDVLVLWRLWRVLREVRPELLQTFLYHANLAGRVAGRLAGIRHIVSGIRVAERRSRLPLWLDRWTSRFVQMHVCVSRAVADFSVQAGGLRPEQVLVIPNGVEVNRFAGACPADLSGYGIPAGSRVIVTIGRLDPQKGLDDLLAAAAQVVAEDPHVQFLLVGAGPEHSRLETQIRSLRLTGRVHLAGWRPDIPEILAASSALVLSSHWEGMPNVVLEAMAAGLPVVVTQVEGIGELVVEGVTGLIVPPRRPAELAAAIRSLLADPVAASARGRAGQERVRAGFTWDQAAAQYEELYRSLLAGGHTG